MSYFLSAQTLELNKQFEITGEEARHILFARRVKVGEKIALQDPAFNRFLCEVVSFNKKSIIVRLLETITPPKESSLKIVLFQSLVSENALDTILQKSTELGVAKIVLFNSHNTPTHLGEKVDKKMTRWQKIIQEACKQSNRLRAPEIIFLNDLESAVSQIGDLDKVFLLEKTTKRSFPDFADKKYKNVGILIGPEGGFTQEEIDGLEKLKNLAPVKLGPRILRADTAAISSAAIVQTMWGDM